MSHDFATILQGLMENRRLSQGAVSRASGRAESTIARLTRGVIPPTAEILQDVAPVLEMPLDDLLVIASLPREHASDRPGPYQASSEIGSLVAAASWLTPEQVEQLVQLARNLKTQNLEDQV